jgi:mono/diheme cytochrome c family protein
MSTPSRLRRLLSHFPARTGAAVAAAALLAGCSTGGGAPAASAPAAPATAALEAEPAVREALERTCYDCHSDRGTPRWYGRLSFSYWDSGGAQKHLDFSSWQTYDAKARKEHLEAIEKTVKEGEMPPWDYTLLLSSAKLRPEEKDAVVRWASEQAAATPTP